VYDITDRNSYITLNYWLERIRQVRCINVVIQSDKANLLVESPNFLQVNTFIAVVNLGQRSEVKGQGHWGLQ